MQTVDKIVLFQALVVCASATKYKTGIRGQLELPWHQDKLKCVHIARAKANFAAENGVFHQLADRFKLPRDNATNTWTVSYFAYVAESDRRKGAAIVSWIENEQTRYWCVVLSDMKVVAEVLTCKTYLNWLEEDDSKTLDGIFTAMKTSTFSVEK